MHRYLAILLALAGCGAEDPEGPTEVPDNGQRVEISRVDFNRWTDFLALQAGLNDDCQFMNPLVDNDSTAVPPLQVFWVIYDNESDVKDGSLVEDTYFRGDSLAASDFEEIDGLPALGFKFPPATQRRFLSISDLVLSEDQTSLEATLGSPLSAKLFVSAAGDAGACEIKTTFCTLDDVPCEPSSLSSIYLELSTLFAVKEVIWNP